MTEPHRSSNRLPTLLIAMIGSSLLALPASAATFYTTPVSAQPGQTANVCVWMSGGNDQVAGVQMDLSWDPACMVPASGGNRPKCRSNPDTGKTVQSAQRGSSTLRAIMVSFSDVDPIPDGELFCCEFRVVDNPSGAACGLSPSNVIASTPRGEKTNARFDTGRSRGVTIARAGGAPAAGGFEPSGGDQFAAADPAPADNRDSGQPAAEAPAGRDTADAADTAGTEGTGRAAAEPDSGGTGTTGDNLAGGMPAGAPGAPDRGGETGGGAADGFDRMPAEMAELGRAGAEEGAVVDPSREAGEVGIVAEQPLAATDEGTDGDETDEAEGTETPAAGTPTPQQTVAAAATAPPTPTRPATTATPALPTATPTVSSGWLGGCTLIVD